MQTENDTSKPETELKEEAGEGCSGATCSAPIYEHDCDQCTYLGAFKEHDLYHCEQVGRMPTIIARFGSDGPDYRSGIWFAEVDEHIGEGLRRAKAVENAKKVLKRGDRVRCAKCPGAKHTFTFERWDGNWMVSTFGIDDFAASCVDMVNGVPVDFIGQNAIAQTPPDSGTQNL